MLERLTVADFAPLVDQQFAADLDGRAVPLTLISATAWAGGSPARTREPFSLVFRGPPAPLLLTKAKFLEAAGQPETALQLLTAAAARLPDDPAVAMAAGQAALEHGRLDEAERLARRQLLTGSPARPATWRRITVVGSALLLSGVLLAIMF